MIETYFLGANTPDGFHSVYDTLQRDPRIRQLRILKGGSGCGKSTLMRTVGEAAARMGLVTEQILCSSDPDSLDGLVIPELGLALADGTAPHVLEPELCGFGANYLDLGRWYRTDPDPERLASLRREKAANRACYGPAYSCLAGAASAQQAMRQLAAQGAGQALTDDALQKLQPDGLPAGKRRGGARRCFLTAVTPAGLRSLEPRCGTLWAIEDSFRIGGWLIRKLAALYRDAGMDVILVSDPMDPGELTGVLIPDADAGYLRTDPLFELGNQSLLRLRLDAPLLAALSESDRASADRLQRARRQFTEEAVGWLARAKAHHDAIEALCRPMVDFAGVRAETERLIRQLLTETD